MTISTTLIAIIDFLSLPPASTASPANSKLPGLSRMTTLHEEPLSQRVLIEENEDSFSDPECNDYEGYEDVEVITT